jgi:hypothetical protein
VIRALLIAAPLVLVHGDAEWIMQEPRYKDVNGVHCCGPSDCKRIARTEVQYTPEGYLVHGMLFGYEHPALYQSIDSDFWLCEREVPKCLFTPEGSS